MNTPIKNLVAVATCIIALSPTNAAARMYQWSNSSSGIVQLSGSPPAWYRSATKGPRVLVFDNGQLIDDTALAVAEELRLSLRADAFGETDDVAEAPAPPPAAPQEQLRDALMNAAREGVDVRAVAEEVSDEQRSAEVESVTESVEDTVAELKSLLDAWDLRRVDEAKALLRDAAEPAAQAGPPDGRWVFPPGPLGRSVQHPLNDR